MFSWTVEIFPFICSSSLPCPTRQGVPYVEKGSMMNQTQAPIRWWSVPSARRLFIVSASRYLVWMSYTIIFLLVNWSYFILTLSLWTLLQIGYISGINCNKSFMAALLRIPVKARSIRICRAAGNVPNVTKEKTRHQRYLNAFYFTFTSQVFFVRCSPLPSDHTTLFLIFITSQQ